MSVPLEVLNFRWRNQLGNSGTKAKYLEEQRSIKQFLGSREQYNAKIMIRKKTI